MSHFTTTARSIIILFVSFQTSCGNKAVSEDKSESLSYTCKNDSVAEAFSIPTFRYYGAERGDAVYFHCDLRVCLADVDISACQCPTDAKCDPKGRKRRSLADEVDETKVYHTSTGPFIFKNDEEEEEEKEGMQNSFLSAKLVFLRWNFQTTILRRPRYLFLCR